MNPKTITLRPMSPLVMNSAARRIITELRLDESHAAWLPFTHPATFEPEVDQCHFNAWVQCNHSGGEVQPGWIISEAPTVGFIEAQFHTVWRSPQGLLVDVTPRADSEDKVLFVPDMNRAITLSDHLGAPAIFTYSNLKMQHGRVLSDLSRIKVVPLGDFLYRHGLAEKRQSNPGMGAV